MEQELINFFQSMWGAVGFILFLFSILAYVSIFNVRKSILILLLTSSLFGLYNVYYVIDSHLGRATFRELPEKFYVVGFHKSEVASYLWILEDITDANSVRAYGINRQEMEKIEDSARKNGFDSIEGKVITFDGNSENEPSVRDINPEKDLNISKEEH